MNKPDSGTLLGLFAVLVGLGALLVMPSQIAGHRLLSIPEVRSPAFFPTLISALLIGIGMLLVLRGLAGRIPRGPEQGWPQQFGNVVATLAIIVGYAVLIFVVGFYIASAIAVVLLAPTLGHRGRISIAIAAVGISLLAYVLFERSLNVFLPRGWVF